MCGYFCIRFIDFMLPGKKLIDYTNLFSPYDFKKNNNIVLSYFKNEMNECNSIINNSFKTIDKQFYLNKQNFDYKCYWSTSWNSKCKFYFTFFFSNWNS